MTNDKDFNHTLVTRFNLATPGRESNIRNRPGWLAERFDLFERHCLPAVAAQTRTDFRWVILFDIDTPAMFRERIERYRQVVPFTPVFTPMFRGDAWVRIVREATGITTPWLLTTRLDNDDAIARDFVERLHAAVLAAPTERSSFNFTHGFVVSDGRVYALRHPSNAFVSLFEANGPEATTVMAHQHMEIGRAGPVRQIDGPGAWVQIVHGGNVSNKVRGWRVAPEALVDRIPQGIVGPLADVTSTTVTVENLFLSPLRAGRDRVINWLRGRQ